MEMQQDDDKVKLQMRMGSLQLTAMAPGAVLQHALQQHMAAATAMAGHVQVVRGAALDAVACQDASRVGTPVGSSGELGPASTDEAACARVLRASMPAPPTATRRRALSMGTPSRSPQVAAAAELLLHAPRARFEADFFLEPLEGVVPSTL